MLPRGAGILLAVSGPTLAFASPIGVEARIDLGYALFGLGLWWLGYALRSATGRQQPSSE